MAVGRGWGRFKCISGLLLSLNWFVKPDLQSVYSNTEPRLLFLSFILAGGDKLKQSGSMSLREVIRASNIKYLL